MMFTKARVHGAEAGPELREGVILRYGVDAARLEAGLRSVRLPDEASELAPDAFLQYNLESGAVQAVTALLRAPWIRAAALEKQLLRSRGHGLPPEVRRLPSLGERRAYLLHQEERCRLLRLELPVGLTRVHPGSFPMLLEAIEAAEDNPAFCSVDGVLFSRDGMTLVRYPGLRADRDYAVPEGVTAVERGAFSGCHIGTLVLPGSLRYLEPGAFSGGWYDTVRLGEGIIAVGEECFRDCRIRCLELPASLERIEDAAFAGLEGLTALHCPDSAVALGSCLFRGSRLEDVDWWCWSTIPSGTFLNSRLGRITVPEGVEVIGAYAFAGCGAAREIALPPSVGEIGSLAFDEGPAYSGNVRLPAGLSRYLLRLPVCSTVNGDSRLPLLRELCAARDWREDAAVLRKQREDLGSALARLSPLRRRRRGELRIQLELIEKLLAGHGEAPENGKRRKEGEAYV